MKTNLKICFFTLLFFFSNELRAQTNITSSGTFIVNGESFTSVFSLTSGTRTPPYQLVLLFNNRSVDVTDASLSSTTCNGIIGSLEERKYRFAKNRANSMQMFAIFKTVFPPQRCAQLTNATFSIDVSIFPSNNVINGIAYNFDSRISITQEEIAQLDNLIRTTTNFTFPKSTGICNNISLIGLGGIDFKFNELHTNPYYNGIGTSFDGE